MGGLSKPFKKVGKAVGNVVKGVGDVYKTVYYDAYAKNLYRYVYKSPYNLMTGHYHRQQERIEKDQQREAERVERQQREYAYNQRKEQIDALRERVGAGGSRYRTDRQKMANSLWGSGNNVETLG